MTGSQNQSVLAHDYTTAGTLRSAPPPLLALLFQGGLQLGLNGQEILLDSGTFFSHGFELLAASAVNVADEKKKLQVKTQRVLFKKNFIKSI